MSTIKTDAGANPVRHTKRGKIMIKIGTKVLSKHLNVECTFKYMREEPQTGEVFYTFERKVDGSTVLSTVEEKMLEDRFYFLVEDHPLVLEQDRKKSKKTREKVDQPTAFESLMATVTLNVN